MDLKHVMLDIETLGTGTNAAIVSIGALTFDPMLGQVMDPRDTRAFHVLIDLEHSKQGGVIDAGTVKWWMQQSPEARNALFGQDPKAYDTLGVALAKFAQWAQGTTQLWSNGPLFDERIMREAFTRNQNDNFPHSYRASRCFRTIAQLVEDRGNDLKKLHAAMKVEVGDKLGLVAHRAIDDCYSQAYAVCRFYQILGLAPVRPIIGCSERPAS